jgi:peroxiredoxin
MLAKPELVPVGAAAPEFALASPGRGTIRLADHRGREHVLLVFMRAFG